MIGEVAKVAVDVAKEAAKEVVSETTKEVGKAATTKIDITKRMDVTKTLIDGKGGGVDVTKRIMPDKLKADVVKELNPKQIKELTDKGMSPGIVNDCKFKDGVYKLKTINEKLADTTHPETGVPYKKKVVDLFGTKVEGVFPKFDAAYSTKLPMDKLLASDKVQFDHCISQLQNDLKKNPALKEKFTKRELDQIANGKTPSRFTWNHNEEVGKMELVDAKTHDMTKHTGGKAIWGGGKAYR